MSGLTGWLNDTPESWHGLIKFFIKALIKWSKTQIIWALVREI